ncbi:MAG: Gfo/Idh/MocA family oxidoreductase [Candidatus Obscuribacterales bacterium]|nr:Gfo/Idh/MocA family oxidoreductase [Candidatus Obscuribacterales bacterium]
MKQIRIGVIGYGYWGPNLVRNFNDDSRADVAYVCDPQAAMLEKHRTRYKSVKFTSDLDELLLDKELDAVAIATPVDTHYSLAKAALEAGKHVLIEKPLCRTSSQGQELVNIAAERKLVLMVDHTFIYHGPIRLIKKLILQADLGEILFFNSVRVNLGNFQRDVNVLWDLGAHDLAIMDYLIGKRPREVFAIGSAHTDSQLADIAYLTMKFERDLIAHVNASWLSPVKVRQIVIGGTRRMIVFDDNSQVEKVKIYDKGIENMNLNLPTTASQIYSSRIQYRHGDMVAPVYDVTEALRVAVRHFLDCVTTGETPITDGAAGVRVVRMLEQADVSLASGKVTSYAAGNDDV